MGELELVGLHDDGEHLVLSGPDGQRFRLRIDEPLRAAVRRDRPQLEQLRAERASALAPREIQARIRAGATAQEVAASAGLPLEAVQRYEGPVLAEREYIAELARGTAVGRELGAPTLGDLVTDRLATRGVDPASLSWDAAREGSSPWAVLARFRVADESREARWSFDSSARALSAIDDEARWLSETELDEPVARRHLSAVRDVVFDLHSPVTPTASGKAGGLPAAPAEAELSPQERTAAMLDDLRARRGLRQAVDLDDDSDQFEGFGPQHAFDLGAFEAQVPGAHPVDADPAGSARVLPGRAATGDDIARALPSVAVPVSDEPSPAERPRARRPRAKVPSWDEIVFGAKPE